MKQLSADLLNRTFDELLEEMRFFSRTNAFEELLGLFALKVICDTGAPWETASRTIARPKLWDDIVKVSISSPQSDHADLVLSIAYEVEAEYECLDGVFTKGLLTGLRSFPTDGLSQVILRTASISSASLLAETPFAFGHWFNAKVDSLVMITSDTQESATLPSVAELMVQLVDLASGVTIFDPCCGVGTILAKAIENDRERAEKHQLYGQEINVFAWSLCKLRLFTLGHNVTNIVHGNALQRPVFTNNGDLSRFDRVLCDPPFGMPFRDQDFARSHIRFPLGKPGSIEGAFIQVVLASLKPTGKAVALVSHSFLFRSGPDARIREGLIKSGNVQVVIGLPKRSRANAAVETALVLLQNDSSPHGAVFIDASNLQPSSRGRAELTNETIRTIVELSLNGANRPHVSRFATLEEIQSSACSLLPRRYISGPSESVQDINEIKTELSSIEHEYHDTIQEMDSLLHEISPNE
ncbi:MAG TPA: class I SAM-dependent DNA methyltransferase [Candidatus Angelobacter sp.]|jgi:hypothetical protein|nr:class I SAM-dependent DNA methyltransferase [Candidatus Angelobacter sp.]